PELLVPTLTQLCEAANRQVRVFRNLKAGRRLAEEALELAHVSLESTGGEEVGRFAYQALECLLDVCNHQGDVAGAVGVMRREAELRRQVGLHALVESFEFRNRAAESAVNEFDFRGAGEALDGLRREIEEVGRHFPLGARVATLGRVLSHRAQVHHYLGEDKQALALYAGAGEHYSTPLDREILTQHRVRSFLGMGKGLDAWAGIRSLGVTRELAGLRADDPFLLDLVALAGRFAVEDGPGSKLSWLPRVLLGRPQLLARALGRSTQSGYPGAATAASVARIAAFLGDAARSVESTLWAMQLASRDEVPTMHAITLGAALEGLDNLRQLDATKRSEAAEFFGVAEAMAEVLTREGQPAPLRSHFLPALDTLRRWKGPQAALAEPAILRRLIRRVPFGRVGGFPLVWVEKAAQLERSRRAR
ncbi:MAG TPA: hypothetical protein P5076_08175, partial [Myxococcota bacterium]|nr:hypothetical protein [Myxococcota bacterium]